jgi:hypothetical protein
LGSFPQNYRPRTLEERIRRSHQKQLEAQIESLNRCRKTDGPKNLHEKVALRQAAAEARAAAEAAAAALVTSEAAGENGATSPVNQVGGTPRTRSNSNSIQTSASTRSNSLSSARNLPSSLSNTRLSNAESTAPQASAVAAAIGGLTIDAPDNGSLSSQTSFSSPDRPDRTPLSRNTHPIPEENPDELNAASVKASSAIVYSNTSTDPTATAAATEEAPDAITTNPTAVSSSSVTVEPSARTSPVPRQESPVGHLGAKESSIETIPASPIKATQSERELPLQDSPMGHLGARESSIETIVESPVKLAVPDQELSAPRLGSSGGDGSTPHGGRKGLEIARAKENDSFFEAQLGSAPEELSMTENSPLSQSHTVGNGTSGDVDNSADSGMF